MRRSRCFTFLAVATTLGGLATACTESAGGSPPPEGGVPTPEGDASPADGGGVPTDAGGGSVLDVDTSACAAIPASYLPVGASPAVGLLSGGVTGVVCPGGASAQVESAGARYDTEPYFFVLTYTVGPNSSTDDFVFTGPQGASQGEVDVLLGIPSSAPGQYSSSSGQPCGGMALTYYLPVPPGVDCESASGPTCPAGCGSVCSGQGCEACTPQQPSVSFQAEASTDCLGDTTLTFGSWSLALTSVTAVGDDAGGSQDIRYFTPHGTFTATMPADGDAGASPATLTVDF